MVVPILVFVCFTGPIMFHDLMYYFELPLAPCLFDRGQREGIKELNFSLLLGRTAKWQLNKAGET